MRRKTLLIVFIVFAGPLLSGMLYLGGDNFRAALPVLQIAPVPPSGSAPAKEITAPTVDLPTPIGQMTESNETVSRNYTWSYRGRWSWEMKLPAALYDYYRSLPRPPTRNYSVYVTNPLDDQYIEELAAKISNAAQKAHFTGSQTVQFAAAFVQSLPYTADNVTTGYDEYPRYPVETLVDNGGDCEDTAILLSALLDELGYRTVLINLPGHFALGVKDIGNMTGANWENEGDKYYYIETTGNNWRIGVLPEEYKGAQANVYSLIPVPIVTHTGNFTADGMLTSVNLVVSNLGTAAADNVTVLVGFDAGSDTLWNAEQCEPFVLGPDEKSVVKLQLKVPRGKLTRLVIRILVNGVLADDSHSVWFNT